MHDGFVGRVQPGHAAIYSSPTDILSLILLEKGSGPGSFRFPGMIGSVLGVRGDAVGFSVGRQPSVQLGLGTR